MSEAGASGRRRTALRPGVGKQVVDDLLRGDLKRSLGRDLGDLYDFYVDAPTHERVGRMGRVRRAFALSVWLLKSLILRLSPSRRVLLVCSLVLLTFNDFHFRSGGFEIGLGGNLPSYLLVLLVLMLELKDKLLAREELEAGRAVQLALMPAASPQLDGWDLWLHSQPANDVGGDLVDHLPLGDGVLGLAVGDVAGKGLGAALLMAKLQSTLRALAADASSLAELGERTNRILCRDGIRGRFASLAFLAVEAGHGRVRLLNAGHPPPLAVAGGKVARTAPVALALGLQPDAVYVEQSVEVPAGGLLLLYSDGVTEARNRAGELFGEARLQALAVHLEGLSAEAAGRRVLAEVKAFAGEGQASDDLSLAVLRRLP